VVAYVLPARYVLPDFNPAFAEYPYIVADTVPDPVVARTYVQIVDVATFIEPGVSVLNPTVTVAD
jgi:hypothetical protein